MHAFLRLRQSLTINLSLSQEPPAEPQSYLDARSQDGSSTHGSTSDDTGSSLSTVVDRFSNCDRLSTTSEQPPAELLEVNADVLLANGLADLSNPDFLLTRLANSEARTHVESRGDVERVTAVVAPNTILIEETPALQPPLSFQDAPLSYGHEPRPGIFYSADLAADSRTHFRPIKDDAEVVEQVFNGETREAPPLPARNHVNRIPINQQQEEAKAEEPMLPPKPMPRKDVKAKRKRPPPPPPPPRREPPPPVPEARNIGGTKKVETEKRDIETAVVEERDGRKVVEEEVKVEVEVVEVEKDESSVIDENASERPVEGEVEHMTNKVLEIVEMKKAKALSPQKEPSRISDEYEVPERGADASVNENDDDDDDADDDIDSHKFDDVDSHKIDVELKNSINRQLLIDASNSCTTSMEVGDSSNEEAIDVDEAEDDTEDVVDHVVKDSISEEESVDAITDDYESAKNEEQDVDDIVQLDADSEEDAPLVEVIMDERVDAVDEDEVTDESDGDDYYWQSNLATIGEEEETNSLEYENAYVSSYSFCCVHCRKSYTQ